VSDPQQTHPDHRTDADEQGRLSSSDVHALRRADSVCFHTLPDGSARIDALLTTWAHPHPRIFTTAEQRLFPDPDHTDRRRRIPVTAAIVGFNQDGHWFERGLPGATAFAMIHADRLDDVWRTLAAFLRVGDVLPAIDLLAAIVGSVYLVMALSYSPVLRRVILLGQVTVAALFAVPLLYGGWIAVGGVRAEHWMATALVTLFVFARETLKAVPDWPGDLAAGYHTIATRFGEPAALSVFRTAAAVFCLASLAATLVVHHVAYFLAALLCAVVPTMHTIRLVKGSPSPSDINAAISFSGLVFATGIIPMLLMR